MPETLPSLADGEVEVWRIELQRAGDSRQEIRGLLQQAYAALTAEERERAARMREGAPREEFVAGRGCLRRLLGAALEEDPRKLVLEAGAHGKPRLRQGAGASVPRFNVSHSRGIVLIALSRAGEVGVDVEYVDPAVELMDVARTSFHAGDLERMERARTQEERLQEFYRCWTRKEAVAKADGRGLTLEPVEFRAGAGDGEEYRVTLPVTLPVDGPRASSRFYVRGIDVGSTHFAALATTRAEVRLGLFEMSARSPLLFAE